MAYADLPLDALRRYRPEGRAPADLRDFWGSTLEEHRGHPIDATATPAANNLRAIETADVTFAGFDGRRVRAWLHRPAGFTERLPAIAQFHGGPKEIVEYPFNGHEGGGAHHEVAKLAFFDQHLR